MRQAVNLSTKSIFFQSPQLSLPTFCWQMVLSCCLLTNGTTWRLCRIFSLLSIGIVINKHKIMFVSYDALPPNGKITAQVTELGESRFQCPFHSALFLTSTGIPCFIIIPMFWHRASYLKCRPPSSPRVNRPNFLHHFHLFDNPFRLQETPAFGISEGKKWWNWNSFGDFFHCIEGVSLLSYESADIISTQCGLSVKMIMTIINCVYKANGTVDQGMGL